MMIPMIYFYPFKRIISPNIKVLLGLALLILLFTNCDNRQIQQAKPNIILINVDDMGWRDVGFMGSKFYSTPNIDRLSSQGMKFMNGYAAAANCAPSRASLMSGLWTPRHGIYTVNSSERGKSKDRKLIPIPNTETLDTSFSTFPRVLQDNGYLTCAAGKWHLSDDPLSYGFDVNIGGNHKGNPGTYYPPYRNVDMKAKNGEYLTDLIMTKSIAFVESAEEPFFLYYSPYAVHTPLNAVDSLKYKYEGKPSWERQENIAYATMVENLDRNIGSLLDAIEKKGVEDNTLIIFTSDNGGLFGITYQLPLRDGKGSYYEGGIRVPFFFSWKNKIGRGEENEEPISNLDLFPTILDLAGINYSAEELDGYSLAPLLLGKKNHLEPRPLFWHFPVYLQAYDKNNNQSRDSLFRTRPGSVVRLGEWKLHHYFEDNALELYNLQNDEGEKRNVVAKFPEKVKELHQLLDQWRIQTQAPIPSEWNPEYEN